MSQHESDENIPLAVGYRLLAVTFQNSAETLSKTMELDGNGVPVRRTAVPFYFLISHAAELFLKSALLKRGMQESDLKKFDYRHSLNSLLTILQNKGILVSPETVTLIKGLHEQHRTHALRYAVFVDNGKKTYWPPVSAVLGMLDELLMLTRISTQGK
jgi:hypothetical protein